MPTKLKFKGDKPKKKRKHTDGDDGEEPSQRRRRREDDNEDDETWVRPDNVQEIRGPVFIVHPSDPAPVCIAFDATRGRAVVSPLDKDRSTKEEGEEGEAEAEDGEENSKGKEEGGVLSRTPTDVSQVWVSTRVAGAESLTLRTGTASATGSGETKFLSCDEHGLVSAFREARGPQESWTPVVFPDGMVAFQNVYEKYLGVDEVAGGARALRGDAEEVGFNERFWVKVQSRYKREAGEEERKKKEGERKAKIDEAGTNHVYQAWGAGRSVTSQADKAELKKARKEGKLAEALLDRRAKLKSELDVLCFKLNHADALRCLSYNLLMLKHAYAIAHTCHTLRQHVPQLTCLIGLDRRLSSTSTGMDSDAVIDEQTRANATQKKETQPSESNNRPEDDHSSANVQSGPGLQPNEGKQKGEVGRPSTSSSSNEQTSTLYSRPPFPRRTSNTHSQSHSQSQPRSQTRPSGPDSRNGTQKINFPRMPYSKTSRGKTPTPAQSQSQARAQGRVQVQPEEDKFQSWSDIINKSLKSTVFGESDVESTLKEVEALIAQSRSGEARDRQRHAQPRASVERDGEQNDGSKPPERPAETRRSSELERSASSFASRPASARPSPWSMVLRDGQGTLVRTRPYVQGQGQGQARLGSHKSESWNSKDVQRTTLSASEAAAFESLFKKIWDTVSQSERSKARVGEQSDDSGTPRPNDETRRPSDTSASRPAASARSSSQPKTRPRLKNSRWLLPILREHEEWRTVRVIRDPRSLSLLEAEAKLGMSSNLYNATFAYGKRRGARGAGTERWRRKQAADSIKRERGAADEGKGGKVRGQEKERRGEGKERQKGKRGDERKGREERRKPEGQREGTDSFAQIWTDFVPSEGRKANEGSDSL